MQRFLTCCLALMIIVGTLPQQKTSAQTGQQAMPDAYQLDAAVAKDWMLLTYELVRDNNLSAPEASRIYAYAGITLYESIVGGMPENYSISGVREDLPLLPFPDPQDYEKGIDWISSANAALTVMIGGLFADSDDAQAHIDALQQQYVDAQTAQYDEMVVERSAAYGVEIGTALLEWATADNYQTIKSGEADYEMQTGEPFMWTLTSEGSPVNPLWGTLRPFGLPYAEFCDVNLRLEYSTDPSSTFYKQALEVLTTSDNLTDEQREIARFWVDTPGITGAPSGHWLLIGVQIIDVLDLKLSRAAEMFTLMNIAVADAFISAWSLKYRAYILRPVTYINQNIRRNWTPYIQSPLFPEYPSGHSVASGAAATVLTTMFGQVAFDDRTPIINGHENLQRSFTSFDAAAYEAAISRLYGGIHYRAAIENGLDQGACIGNWVLDKVRLRPIPQGE